MSPLLVRTFLLCAIATPVGAAEHVAYPQKPVHVIVGFPAGGPSDVLARLVGQKLSEAWGKPVIVENVPGAGGSIGASRAARAAPDGYTLWLTSFSPIVINPALYKVAYDPVKDFTPVSQVSSSSNILMVHHAVPARNVRELVALAKARPRELSFASGGNGGQNHLAGEWLKSMAGIDITHVPYKGTPAALPDLLGGRVMMVFGEMSLALPLVREKKLRALAVTSLQRSAMVPELPTMHESGFPGFEVTPWYGLLATAGTAASVVRKVNSDTIRLLGLADVRVRFADLGMEAVGTSPDDFAALIKVEIPKWAKIIAEARIKAD